MQLIQARNPQKISGEVVAIGKLRITKQVAIKHLQLLVHRRSNAVIRGEIHLHHGGGEQPMEWHRPVS